MQNHEWTANLQMTCLLAHNPAADPNDLLFSLIFDAVIGLLFLGGFVFLLRTIWRLLKKERPPKQGARDDDLI